MHSQSLGSSGLAIASEKFGCLRVVFRSGARSSLVSGCDYAAAC